MSCSAYVLEIYHLLVKAAKHLAMTGSEYAQREDALYTAEYDINAQIDEAA